MARSVPPLQRRDFLRLMGIVGVSLAFPSLTACARSQGTSGTAGPAQTPQPGQQAKPDQPPAAPALKTVRHGLLVGNLGSLALTLPKVEARYNLKYDIKIFRDTTAALMAVDQGEIEMCNLTTQHLIRAIEEGMNVVMVAGWGGGYNTLIAQAGLPVNQDDWAGLKTLAAERKRAGTPIKIGVPTGSLQHLKLVWALKAAGIDPDKDVQVLNVPFAEHPRAIEQGQIDLAMAVAVFGAMSIVSGKGKLFHHLVGGRSGKQEIGFAVSRKLVEKDPDLVQRIVASHVDAMKQFVSDVNKQVELELEYTKLPKPVVEMAQGKFLKLNYRVDLEDIKGMAKEMYEVGWTKRDHSDRVKDFVDLRFLAKATGESVEQLSTWK